MGGTTHPKRGHQARDLGVSGVCGTGPEAMGDTGLEPAYDVISGIHERVESCTRMHRPTGRPRPVEFDRSGSSWSQPDPEVGVALSFNTTAESPPSVLDRVPGSLPMVLLLTRLGRWPESVARVRDVVLHAEARYLPNTVFP